MPYIEKVPESQRNEEASIAKGHHPKALYNAALSKIGKLDKNHKNIAYMMRKFKKHQGLAAEAKKWYLKYRKKKGI